MAQVEDSGTTAEGVKSYVVDPSRPPRTKITYLTWTADGLLRHTVYVGLREDKPADEVRKETARSINIQRF
jgi:ATP-dependent DNA ligase